MAVLHAGVHDELWPVVQLREPGDQLRGLGGGDVSGRVVAHDPVRAEVLGGHEVHAPYEVVVPRLDALGGGLDGAAAGVVVRGVESYNFV